MESDQSYDPMTALDDAQAARDRLASRAITPRYYYLTLGSAFGLFVGLQSVGSVVGFIGALLLAVTAGALIRRYRELTGMWISWQDTHGRSRSVWTAYVVLVAALLAAALFVQLTDRSGWWGVPLGLTALAATLLTGRVLDPVLREDIRSGVATPAADR